MVGSLLNPRLPVVERQAIDLAFAADVVSNLADFSRLATLSRPVEIDGFTDESLAEKIRFIEATEKRSQQDRETVSAFASWRSSVLLVESRNIGRVEGLLYVARTLERIGPEYPETRDFFRRVRDFLRVEWGVNVPPVPNIAEGAEIARRVAFEGDVLPNGLRSTDAPWRAGKWKRSKAVSVGDAARSWMNQFESEEDE